MFAFKTLFVAGLAAFASAAPLGARHDQPAADVTSTLEGAASTIESTISSTIATTATLSASSVPSASASVPAPGGEGPKSLTDILNEVVAQLQPLTDTLNGLTKETATEDKVTEITKEIEGVLSVAIEEVNSLVSSPLDAILGLLDIGGLGQLIGSLLNLVFGALGFVLTIVTNPESIKPLLVSVGKLVTELLSAVLGLGPLGDLVGSLLTTVLGLVGDVTNVIADLGLTDLTGILGL